MRLLSRLLNLPDRELYEFTLDEFWPFSGSEMDEDGTLHFAAFAHPVYNESPVEFMARTDVHFPWQRSEGHIPGI